MNDKDIPPPADKLQRTVDHERGLRRTVPRVIQSAGRAGAFPAGGERGKMRASDADRDRVVELLNLAYSEGRLSKDEYDARLDSAMSARTFADLDLLVTDLPSARSSVVFAREPRSKSADTPPRRGQTNSTKTFRNDAQRA